MKKWVWAPLAVALVFPSLAFAAWPTKNCYIEECASSSYNPQCYTRFSYKWCQRTCGGGICWTPINTYNHTRYPQVATAWSNWNYPPAGFAQNTVYMTTDGINNGNHDIDYWEANNSGVFWWGLWSVGGTSGGCINRGAGAIYMNVYYIGSDSWKALMTANHETGHGIGLGHVCYCSIAMEPCFNCGTNALSSCDAAGANAIYP